MVAVSGNAGDNMIRFAGPEAGDPHSLARLGDLLPQVLQRYGVAAPDASTAVPSRSSRIDLARETNRPGVAPERRRVG